MPLVLLLHLRAVNILFEAECLKLSFVNISLVTVCTFANVTVPFSSVSCHGSLTLTPPRSMAFYWENNNHKLLSRILLVIVLMVETAS